MRSDAFLPASAACRFMRQLAVPQRVTARYDAVMRGVARHRRHAEAAIVRACCRRAVDATPLFFLSLMESCCRQEATPRLPRLFHGVIVAHGWRHTSGSRHFMILLASSARARRRFVARCRAEHSASGAQRQSGQASANSPTATVRCFAMLPAQRLQRVSRRRSSLERWWGGNAEKRPNTHNVHNNIPS